MSASTHIASPATSRPNLVIFSSRPGYRQYPRPAPSSPRLPGPTYRLFPPGQFADITPSSHLLPGHYKAGPTNLNPQAGSTKAAAGLHLPFFATRPGCRCCPALPPQLFPGHTNHCRPTQLPQPLSGRACCHHCRPLPVLWLPAIIDQ